MSVDILTEITIDRPCMKWLPTPEIPTTPRRGTSTSSPWSGRRRRPSESARAWHSSRQVLGRRLAYTYEIVDFVPDVRLVMRTAEGPFPMETTYTWEPVGERSTRMTLRNRGEPSGFSRFVAPLMAAAMRRANRKDLARLKSLLEDASALGEGK